MRTRPITSKELQDLRRAFGAPKTNHTIWDFFCISVYISVPLFILFVAVSIFAEKRTTQDAISRGLPILLFGPAFLVIQRIASGRRRVSNPFASAHQVMKAGICQIREFRINRAWKLVDQGNDGDPDYLVETHAKKYIAVSANFARGNLSIRDRLEIHELPKFRATVSIAFSGDEIPIESAPIETDSVWRNDDLPWERPISAKRLPESAQKVALSSASPDSPTEPKR